MSNLVLMRETNLLNVPATLREIADAIEADKYGAVSGCVVVADADSLEVFYCGTGQAGPNAHLLLHAGAAKMLAGVLSDKA